MVAAKKELFGIGVAILIFSLTWLSYAEEQGQGYRLGQVVVTADRMEREIGNVPASVGIVVREDIETSPMEKVEDILRPVAGVEVSYHHGMHTVAGNRPVNLRGTGGYGDRTLVLLDGIPQNNANNGWVEWSQIPKEAIERIEIIRGSSSALYGSNAMGGVINIITRRPEMRRETVFEQSYGSMNTHLTKLAQEGKIGNWGYYLSGGYEETDGYIAAKPRRSYDIRRFRREDRIFAKVLYEISDISKMTLGFSRYHHKMGRGREYFYGYTENNRGWLDWSRRGEKIDWGIQFFINDDEWDSYFDKSPAYDCLYRREVIPMLGWGSGAQANISLSEHNTLTLGLDYKQSDLEKKDTYYTVSRSGGVEGKQYHFSPFLNDEMKFFAERLIVNLGGRYDRIKAYDGKNWDINPAPSPAYDNDFSAKKWNEFSPKLGVLYHLSDATTLRSSLGKGFKAPSLYELYTSLTRGPLSIECNSELEPEEATSYDVGVEHLFSEGLCGKLTFYQTQAKDFIGYDTISSTNWRRDNISKVRIRGIESELDWMINERWSCLANYTYNKSEIREYSPDSTVEGNYLPETAHNTYRLGFSYNNPLLFDARVLFNYNDKRYGNNQNTLKLESYYTVDFRLSKEFGKYGKLSLNVENLFDEEYTVYKGTSEDTIAPGRVMSAVIKMRF